MSYFRTSNHKLYYARTVSEGTGNCGPNVSWACEEIPSTIFGAPIGRSAITVHGNKVHILVETASGKRDIPLDDQPLDQNDWCGGLGWGR